MFDDNNDQQNQTGTDENSAPLGAPFTGSDTSSSDSSNGADSNTPLGAPVLPTIDDQPAVTDQPSETPVSEPADTPSEPSAEPAETTPEPADDSVMTTPPSEDLVSMKQEALGQLQPLVAHLDLTPEEEFKTTMMMIQANDDHTLLKKAFEAAKKITDDKVRAQALLDVINEINYFTQHAE